MAGSVIGAVAGGLASGAASSLLGGRKSAPAPANIVPSGQFGGLKLTGGQDRLAIAPGEQRTTAVNRSANVIGRRADALAAVRKRVTPGFGELTTARLGEIESSRQRAIGNLRENIARRRLSGSSFASDALVRAEREFGQAAATARAESLLQELDVTTQLINQEFTARQGEFERQIQELDFQAQVGTQILSGVSGELGASARLEAELAAKAAAGRGAFFEPATTAIGEGVGSFVEELF